MSMYDSSSHLQPILTTYDTSVGCIIGTGIFSTPSSILSSVGSVGASLMLWVLGFVLSFCGLFIWLEFGTMIPRSGGEKVYLEAVYKKPKFLATIIFAINAVLLQFIAADCIVSFLAPHSLNNNRFRLGLRRQVRTSHQIPSVETFTHPFSAYLSQQTGLQIFGSYEELP